MINTNLKDVIVQIDSNNKKYTKSKTSDYNIYLPKNEFNSIIFYLNTLITDIKNNQNSNYLVSQIEKIIFKLKKYDIPPEIQLYTIPTFETIDLQHSCDNNVDNINTSSIGDKLKELGLDSQIYSSNADIDNQTNDDLYEGELINGKKEGKGKYKYKNGCIYEGFFKNDKKDGNGIFYYPNGDRYKGLFKDGYYQGNGIFFFHNGDRYEGEFNKNKYEGNGKYFYHNGDKFEGLWKDDKKNGKGTYIYLNGDTISGNYKNGKPIGIHFKLNAKGKMTQIKYSDDI